jgi:hypothetical protein
VDLVRRVAFVALAALAALGALGAGCGGSSTTVLVPIIEVPPAGAAGDPFPGLQEVSLAAALAGDPDDLVGKTFNRGETLELPGVPVSDGLVIHLSGRASGAEVAYGRTCALDLRREPTLPSPHLYFARTVKWAAAEAPPGAPDRVSGLAFAARDGSAIYLGGTGAAGELLGGVDRFDPASGAWLEFPAIVPRTGAVLAALGDGSVLVIGGADANGVPVKGYQRIDPLAAPVDRVGPAIGDARLALVDHAAATLASGRIVVIGGRAGDAGTVSGDVWELGLAEGGDLDAPRKIGSTLATPRAEHTLTRLSDDTGARVLVAGGVDAAGLLVARAELYRPQREEFADPTVFTAQLNVPRRRHTAVRMPDGSVLIIGGLDASGAAIARLELFSIDGGFQDVGELPGGEHPAGLVDMSATPLPDGRVLLAGGRLTPGGPALPYAFIARLDPTDGSVDVVATDELPTPRAGHQAVLLCDGTVLLVGGTDDPSVPSERYNPPSIGRR